MQHRTHVLLSVILLVTFFSLGLNMFYDMEHGDLMTIYQAAERFRTDQQSLIFGPPSTGMTALYSDDIISDLTFQDSVFGKYLSPDLPYVYPPLWAALLSPVTGFLTVQEFSRIVLIIHLGLLSLSLYFCFRLSDFPKPRFWFWVIFALLIGVFTLPLFLALVHNQPQITIFTLTILSFWHYSKDHSLISGGLLGVAAAIKLLPLFFILIFFADRNWRAVIAFVISSGSLAVLSFVLTGAQLHYDFLHEVSNLRNLIVLDKINFSLEMLMYVTAATLKLGPALPSELSVIFTVAEPDWMHIANPLLMLSGLLLILWAPPLHNETSKRKRLLRMMIAISIWSGLCAPVSWAHYYLMPLFFAPAFPSLIRHGRWAGIACILFPAFALLNASLKPVDGLHWMHSTVAAILFFLCLFFWVVFFPQKGRTTAPE